MKKLVTLSCFLACAAAGAQANAQSYAATVPVPAQFATAKNIFISYAGASAGGSAESKVATTLLEDMQAALVKSGRYTEVAKPADAELSMRLSIESTQSEVTGGSSFSYFFIRLAVYDTKTGMLLWTIDEPINGSNRASTFYRNLNAAAVKIDQDLDSLAAGKMPFPSA